MTSITNNPSRIELTEWFGYAIYGVYVFAAIVVLMNLLIAVMSNTFQEVQVHPYITVYSENQQVLAKYILFYLN